MASVTARVFGVGVGLALLAGCGSSSTGPGTSAGSATSSGPGISVTSSQTTPGTGTATPPSVNPSTPANPSTPVSSPGDITLHGTVGGEGLTCVSFVSTDGRRFALAGPGLPATLVSVARSLGRRTDLNSPPGQPQVATVTLIGHPVKAAMSTCSATVFSVTSASVTSIKNK